MARMARVVIPGTPHHVTQRGNRRQATFFEACDDELHLAIAAKTFAAAGVEIWAPRRVAPKRSPGRWAYAT
jgi:putative transposase